VVLRRDDRYNPYYVPLLNEPRGASVSQLLASTGIRPVVTGSISTWPQSAKDALVRRRYLGVTMNASTTIAVDRLLAVGLPPDVLGSSGPTGIKEPSD